MAIIEEQFLTEEQISTIAAPFISSCGGHWENEQAIPERSVEDFAKAIEAAVLSNHRRQIVWKNMEIHNLETKLRQAKK